RSFSASLRHLVSALNGFAHCAIRRAGRANGNDFSFVVCGYTAVEQRGNRLVGGPSYARAGAAGVPATTHSGQRHHTGRAAGAGIDNLFMVSTGTVIENNRSRAQELGVVGNLKRVGNSGAGRRRERGIQLRDRIDDAASTVGNGCTRNGSDRDTAGNAGERGTITAGRGARTNCTVTHEFSGA